MIFSFTEQLRCICTDGRNNLELVHAPPIVMFCTIVTSKQRRRLRVASGATAPGPALSIKKKPLSTNG